MTDDDFNPESVGLGDYVAKDNEGQRVDPLENVDTGKPRSMLMRLLDQHTSKRILSRPAEDSGIAEHLPFPFMAIVGQQEMRMALLLAVVNENIGGVLLVGPRGIGKTTAARGLSDLLPEVEVSDCHNGFGCMPEDYDINGRDGVCDNCAERLEANRSITNYAPVKLVELPLNARLEDVIGHLNERIAMQKGVPRISRGILSRADNNLLYIDEVNLLEREISNAILDASAQGSYTVRRGPIASTYRSRFMLIGSMNPEEGTLRPQILDRFGLRVVINPNYDAEERQQIYERNLAFRVNKRAFIQIFSDETYYAREDVLNAREMLNQVTVSEEALKFGLDVIEELQVQSYRADFTLFEAGRAFAALEGRTEVTKDDIAIVAPLALRLRHSAFIDEYISMQGKEEESIEAAIAKLNA